DRDAPTWNAARNRSLVMGTDISATIPGSRYSSRSRTRWQPNAIGVELQRSGCELLNQTAWGGRQLQLRVRWREPSNYVPARTARLTGCLCSCRQLWCLADAASPARRRELSGPSHRKRVIARLDNTSKP